MAGGRPPKFSSADDLQTAIDEYFNSLTTVDEEGEIVKEPPTISGLAYHLGMSTECLRNYGTQDKFSVTVKRAKQRVEISLEQILYSGKTPTGAIFSLKNNYGWKDKTETDMNVTGDLDLAAILAEGRKRAESGD
jgi:hypothetical protein